MPGTYGLSANSEEELITRDYIASGNADVVYILADGSQLERSLFMLADYIGMKTPVVLLVNMMDVAAQQGKKINAKELSKTLGIQVIPMTAADKNSYSELYQMFENGEKASGVLREDTMQQIYEDEIVLPFQKIMSLLPESGIGNYSATWLAVKLIEGDEPARDIVSSALSDKEIREIDSVVQGVADGSLATGSCKFKWIDCLLKDAVQKQGNKGKKISRFDRLATSKLWGKPLAILIILAGLVLSIAIAMPLMGICGQIPAVITPVVLNGLSSIGAPYWLSSLIGDAFLGALSFTLMMVSFVVGVSLVFGFIEEVGYMARISYVFDNTMSKLGLQGKAVMPFLVSLGCNIGGVSGTRVIDSWPQRVLAISISWVVPCISTWGVVGLMSALFFGSNAVWVIIALFAAAFLHMFVTAKIFGRKLITKENRTGLIMELPPYHKPKFRNLFRFVLNRLWDVFGRALKVILFVSVVFWALSYTADGDITGSIIYKIGTFIEPVTMWFGLRWQLFMAWIASAMGKEGALGVLSTLFNLSDQSAGIFGAIATQKTTLVNEAAISGVLIESISRSEALAFIFAFFFNVPCLMTIAATKQETHSVSWTLKITAYYLGVSLLISTLVYHIAELIF